MASGVFGLKKVYKRQVENINNGNFVSWTEDFTHGYIMAGKQVAGNNRSSTLRFNYDQETSATLPSASSVLPGTTGLITASSVSNHNYGYYCGGSGGTNYISRLDFATELSSQPGTNLPTNVENAASVSRVDVGYGYFIGGKNPSLAAPSVISTITRLDFATETLSPMPSLPGTSLQGIRGFNGTTYGYAIGGGEVAVSTIYRLDFSNNTLTISLPSNKLKTARTNYVANESSLYGYISAGQSPNGVSTIERLDFATENIITLSTCTSAVGQKGTNFSSLVGGYMMGMDSNAFLDRLEFLSETITSNLNINDYRENSSTVNARHKKYNNTSGTAAYVNGGTSNSNVDKFLYKTETWISALFQTIDQQANTGGASSNSYGYIFGGQKGTGQTSQITRIDFSNDSYLQGKKLTASSFCLPSSVTSLSNSGVTHTNSYAYYISGKNSNSNLVFKMDFFTENFINIQNIPTQTNNISPVKSKNNCYFIGDVTNSTVFRLNFSNETFSTSLVYPLNLSTCPSGYAYSEQYGYFMGGSNVTSIHRLNFSNDTFSLLPQSVLAGTKRGACYSFDDVAYINTMQLGDSALSRFDFSNEVLTQLSPSPSNRVDSTGITNANT